VPAPSRRIRSKREKPLSRDVAPRVHPSIRRPDDERFRRRVTLLIAGTALLAAIAAALHVDASGRAATVDREGRAYLLKAVGRGSSGTQRYALERGLLAEFQSLVTDGSLDLRLAQEAGSRAEAAGHLQEATRLAVIRESLRGFSTLLSPPYYDEKSGVVDVLQFGADSLTVPRVKWAELESAQSAQARAWEAKSDRYVLAIVLLALSLFLSGLSLLSSGRLRPAFAALGGLVALAALAGTAAAMLARIPPFSEESINQFADGAGKLSCAGNLDSVAGDSAEAEEELVRRTDLAIAGFSRAVALNKRYAAAHLALGEAHLLLGRTFLFSRARRNGPGEAGDELGLAVDSLRTAIALGSSGGRVWADLGWAYCLDGDYGLATAAADKALALVPDRKLALGLNAAVALVSGGRRGEGFTRLEQALLWAEAHPSASDAFTFRRMIRDVDRLTEVRPRPGLDSLGRRLKEAFVSLTCRGTVKVEPTEAWLGSLVFTRQSWDVRSLALERRATTSYPSGTGRVDFLFTYKGMPPRSRVVQKVYWQGKEAPWLGRDLTWNGAPSGRAAWSIRPPVEGTLAGLNPGRYRVELYVDGNLLQSGGFEIAPNPPAVLPGTGPR
jgi:tetratricopeptide (TPR) repeat protein